MAVVVFVPIAVDRSTPFYLFIKLSCLLCWCTVYCLPGYLPALCACEPNCSRVCVWVCAYRSRHPAARLICACWYWCAKSRSRQLAAIYSVSRGKSGHDSHMWRIRSVYAQFGSLGNTRLQHAFALKRSFKADPAITHSLRFPPVFPHVVHPTLTGNSLKCLHATTWNVPLIADAENEYGSGKQKQNHSQVACA